MFEAGVHRQMPYRFHAPGGGNDAPLLLFLHGVGERGADNAAPLSYAFWQQPRSLAGAETMARHPCHLLIPQCPAGEQWIALNAWSDAVALRERPTEALATVAELLCSYMAANRVDKDRVYIAGLSMGAFGALDLAARRPELFAAGIAVCGGGDLMQGAALARIPWFILHGALDAWVPVENSRSLARTLKAHGGEVHYVEFPEQGHAIWDLAFARLDVIEWLFRARRPLLETGKK